MSTHNIGFHGEIRKISVLFGWEKKKKKKLHQLSYTILWVIIRIEFNNGCFVNIMVCIFEAGPNMLGLASSIYGLTGECKMSHLPNPKQAGENFGIHYFWGIFLVVLEKNGSTFPLRVNMECQTVLWGKWRTSLICILLNMPREC